MSEHHKADDENHRTLGTRAWCFGCQEYCYPSILCSCCQALSLDLDPRVKQARELLASGADEERLRDLARDLLPGFLDLLDSDL